MADSTLTDLLASHNVAVLDDLDPIGPVDDLSAGITGATTLAAIRTGVLQKAAIRAALGFTDQLAPAPTGVAATDTANLTTFLNGLTAGDRALFPGGEYSINAGLQYKPGVFYQGSGMRLDAGTRFKMANAANLDAVIAPVVWYSASATPVSSSWVEWRDVHIDGNQANQTSGAGHCLVVMNFQSTFEYLSFVNGRGDGMLMTNTTLAGNAITNTCNEIFVARCQSRNNLGRGFHLQDATAAKMTDGWIHDCIASGNAMQGFYWESGAGWIISGNHAYSSGRDAYRVDKPFYARIIGNYAESFGISTTTGTYLGINCSSGFIANGALVTISDNTVNVSGTATAGTARGGIWIQASTGATIKVAMANNNLDGVTFTTPTTGIRVACQDSAGVVLLTYNGNLATGFDTDVTVTTTGTSKIAAAPGANHHQTNTAALTFSATPTYNSGHAAMHGAMVRMTLTANVTSATITDGVDGQRILFLLTQDATGGRTIAWPANMLNTPTSVTTANGVTRREFVFDAAGGNWHGVT